MQTLRNKSQSRFRSSPVVACLCCISFVFLLPAPVRAQADQQVLYWTRYQLSVNFSPSVYWTNEADNRRFIAPDVENQLIFHSRLHFLKPPWDVAGGMTVSYAYAQKPEDGYTRVTTELRPVAEISHELPLGRTTLLHRLRIDNRFFETSEYIRIWAQSHYVLRARFRSQARIPLKKIGQQPTIVLRVAEEIMFNANENLFDQNRIYATLDFLLRRNLTVETGYIYIYQQRLGGEEFFSRHVLRLSLLQRIYLRKLAR